YVAVTRRMVDQIDIRNSELVFAGYGIVAPEYGWNDYAGLDVRGKTVIVLVNDPGFATGDSSLFKGRTMTYYGRWTYKYEEAARQGAEGVIVVHQTEPAGYPWAVVQGGWSGPQFYMESEDGNMSRCALEGWISHEAAQRIFSLAGLNFEQLSEAAAHPGFKARPLGLQYSTTLKNRLRHSRSHNVLALLPGTDRSDEIIIYSAHWDHFGVDSSRSGDNIFNGARDNATGTAALLELARAFTALPVKPRRSILFLAVTAEEQGLLGSAYYAAHPVYPLTKTVAVINMDALNIFGKMKDITIIGEGQSELDEYVYEAARAQGRYVRPDPEPEKGIFYRSDHFSFAKQGVPALYTKMGIDHVEHGPEWTQEQNRHWTMNFYHKPDDEYDPQTWDLSGAIDDIRLLFRVGQRLSMEDRFPNWKAGSEFKAKRDADMGASHKQ
ncbi:MAG: M20/M25/M40 family metallo-hydrolase, partial [Calditrichaeota bacterium]